MNFKDTTRHEVSGHAAEMRAVTTAAIVHCPGLPSSGLLQEMHNPTIPLSLREVVASPCVRTGVPSGPYSTSGRPGRDGPDLGPTPIYYIP